MLPTLETTGRFPWLFLCALHRRTSHPSESLLSVLCLSTPITSPGRAHTWMPECGSCVLNTERCVGHGVWGGGERSVREQSQVCRGGRVALDPEWPELWDGSKEIEQTEGRVGGGCNPREQSVSKVVVKVGWMRFWRHGWQDLLKDAPCERKSGEWVLQRVT